MINEELSDILIDHFNYPRNIGIIDYPNGQGYNGDPECGDYLEIYIMVKNNIIADISFWLLWSYCVWEYDNGTCKGKTVTRSYENY